MRKNRNIDTDKLNVTDEQYARYKIHVRYIVIISCICLFFYASDFINEHTHQKANLSKIEELRDSVSHWKNKLDSCAFLNNRLQK